MYTFNFDIEIDSLGEGEYAALMDCEVTIEGMVDGGYEVLEVKLYDYNNQQVELKSLPESEQNYVMKRVYDKAEHYAFTALHDAIESEVDRHYANYKDGRYDNH